MRIRICHTADQIFKKLTVPINIRLFFSVLFYSTRCRCWLFILIFYSQVLHGEDAGPPADGERGAGAHAGWPGLVVPKAPGHWAWRTCVATAWTVFKRMGQNIIPRGNLAPFCHLGDHIESRKSGHNLYTTWKPNTFPLSWTLKEVRPWRLRGNWACEWRCILLSTKLLTAINTKWISGYRFEHQDPGFYRTLDTIVKESGLRNPERHLCLAVHLDVGAPDEHFENHARK